MNCKTVAGGFVIKPVKRLVLILCATFAASLPYISTAAAVEMKFCTENKPQLPYLVGEGPDFNMDKPGLSVEMVRMAVKRAGAKAIFVRQPWKRCLVGLKVGFFDGVFNGSFKSERLQFGQYPMIGDKPDPSRRVTTMSYSLYRIIDTAPDFDGEKFHEINGAIGAPLGYSIVADLRAKGLKVHESTKTEKDFEKLVAGRVVAVAAQTTTGDALLATGRFPKIEKIEPPLVVKPYYTLLSHQFIKAHKVMAETFWRELAAIRTAEFDRLLEKYMN